MLVHAPGHAVSRDRSLCPRSLVTGLTQLYRHRVVYMFHLSNPSEDSVKNFFGSQRFLAIYSAILTVAFATTILGGFAVEKE